MLQVGIIHLPGLHPLAQKTTQLLRGRDPTVILHLQGQVIAHTHLLQDQQVARVQAVELVVEAAGGSNQGNQHQLNK